MVSRKSGTPESVANFLPSEVKAIGMYIPAVPCLSECYKGAVRLLQHEKFRVQSRFRVGNEPHLGTDRYHPHSSSLTRQTMDMSPIRTDEGECIATAKDKRGVPNYKLITLPTW